ncbi:uncharacterized protein N0V89_001878 [Didymosphaeria variabile]|uniref:Uncharacterized protein n=1 Tax=Didymosphaeria variabile TaxID=1932322 RepID=A0A9W8XT31_9PLEO|nr:uncharacterized protein N0V89_001878 [Didymosphaeria variabile]KAJ4357303.1 hypothetical protein N0V89_001878 [Didymosphaeria variabile]
MVKFSLLPAIALYLCLLPNSLLALPTSRFSHDVQSLPIRDVQEGQDASTRHRLNRRGLPGAVYICTGDNFRGSCAWTAPSTQCHIAGTGDDSPRSIGPDENGSCILFENAQCTGNQVKTLRFPGQATNMPTFMSLKCSSDSNGKRGNSTEVVKSGVLPLALEADPRLDGGVGSMERKNLEEVMDQMEKDGFRQGMIGLKKGALLLRSLEGVYWSTVRLAM